MKKLLAQATMSKNGSLQIISRTDEYGNIRSEEIRVSDLRVQLVQKIAQQLVETSEFKECLTKAFTPDVIKKVQEHAINNFKFDDLDYDVKNRIRKNVVEDVKIQKFKIVAEVLEDNTNK